MDLNSTPFIKVTSNRYAHQECATRVGEQQVQDDRDLDSLFIYVGQLFDQDYDYYGLLQVAKNYHNKYHYSYNGMKQSLKYYYEIKKNPIDSKKHNLGIIPYIYQEAYNYYYSLWKQQQVNKDKIIKPMQEQVINIKSPERKINKKKKFIFLDEEENNGQ